MSHPLADTARTNPQANTQVVDIGSRRSTAVPEINVPVIGRKEFLKQFGDNYSQQHVTVIGPTQRGKSRLTSELLNACISPEDKCFVLAGKPADRDPTISKMADSLNLRVIKTWPPEPTYRDRKRNGYILKPLGKASGEVDEEAILKNQFGKALRSLYSRHKPTIIVVDETSLVYEDLQLRKEYTAPLKRGQPTIAVWSLIQRGRNISYHAYDAPEHLFLFHDPDESNRKRYAEIGGVDPRIVQRITENLECREVDTVGPDGKTKKGTVSQALYIRRAGPQLMIVDID